MYYCQYCINAVKTGRKYCDCSIAFIIKYRAFSGAGFASWITRRLRSGAVMQLFVPMVFILNSNYRAFQLDRIKQSGRDSYINRRAIQPVFHPSRKNWFPGAASWWSKTDPNKQAKDAYAVYRYIDTASVPLKIKSKSMNCARVRV